jgi:choline dehydrogenase-like flavoprotein
MRDNAVSMRLLLLLFSIAGLLTAVPQNQPEYDLVVYGGTAGGAITAVSAAREGLHVVLLEAGHHIGGMATGGLSRTDFGKKEVIGGYAAEFYWRVGMKYDMGRFANEVAWYYEPHVGEQVLREMLSEAKVGVKFGERLREKTGVAKTGTRLTLHHNGTGRFLSSTRFRGL